MMILNTFLKIQGVASSGGEAKQIIRSGKVLYNGVVEMRNKKQLFPGDKIEYEGSVWIVQEEYQ